jgi:membrane dipeptidase
MTDHVLTLPAVDLDARAHRLGVSRATLEVLAQADVLDLHVDTFIPVRLWGYDVLQDHGRGPLIGRFFGHLDVPRLALAGVTGAMWSLTTNPFRTSTSRWRLFQRNLAAMQRLVADSGGRLRLARDVAEYLQARHAGAHAVLLSVQGGNALQAAPDLDAVLATGLLTRVTLVHLTDSCYGPTSSPLSLHRAAGLSNVGRDLVQALDRHRVFVDLAHIRARAFWDAVEVHDPTRPLIATHTGVCGVTPHWRNLDDRQVRAIGESGGVVGVIFAANFLKKRGSPHRGAQLVLDHLQHIIDVAGEGTAALGSDYDGAIVPPADLRDGLGVPRLVEAMLQRGWSHARILAILGGNALRALGHLRPLGWNRAVRTTPPLTV